MVGGWIGVLTNGCFLSSNCFLFWSLFTLEEGETESMICWKENMRNGVGNTCSADDDSSCRQLRGASLRRVDVCSQTVY